jgi:hypothetical protein
LDVTDEDVTQVLVHYRATVSEESTTALDESILAAASRRTVHVRAVRRFSLVLALAAVVVWGLWDVRSVRVAPPVRVTDYGRQEGATRYYLLNVAGDPFTGPGSEEQKP